MTRQQRRRVDFKAAKAQRAANAREAAAAELATMRAARVAPVKQGPGKMLTSVRPFKKPTRKQSWRVQVLNRMPNGDPIPAGCEATMHSTKGLRCVRITA